MKVNFNLSVSISGLNVVNNDKRYCNGVVEKEHNENNKLESLNVCLNGSSEMEVSETKEFILGIVDAVKTAAEVKMNEAKKPGTEPKTEDVIEAKAIDYKTNVEKLPKKEINNINYVDVADKEDNDNG